MVVPVHDLKARDMVNDPTSIGDDTLLPTALSIGSAPERRRASGTLPVPTEIRGAEYRHLTLADLTAQPGIVVSPLVGVGFDCMDVAVMLDRAGFNGVYRIVAGPLPRPNMVLGELRARYPRVRAEIVCTTPERATGT